MATVFRIAMKNLLVLIRLAIIASLVGYTLPTAAVAMHGDSGVAYGTVAKVEVRSQQMAMAPTDHDHSGPVNATDDKDQKSGKQECCTDFCVSAAIIADAHGVGTSRSSLQVRHFDEPHMAGLRWPLHRPPSFRA